jgi:hypothetical protein
MRRRTWLILGVVVVVLATASVTTWVLINRDHRRNAAPCRGPSSPEPAAAHPRLLVRPGDLDRLRSWATPANPVYAAGLGKQAERAKQDMDSGVVPGEDVGRDSYVEYPIESYAELFAFLSLVAPGRADRDDYGRRACALIMDLLTTAAKGADDDKPFRQRTFSTSDRSRWWGEGFALTVDWAYPYFSAAEKAIVRTVFLRWSSEQVHANTTDFNHPEPIGVTNDAKLVANPTAVRWALNNYYTAHLRNLGFMALALDEGDDPGGTLRGYLNTATGAFLYVIDHALRTDAAGGLTLEGFEYGPQSVAYVAQFLLGLHTAKRDDPAALGPQVVQRNNPFWTTYLPAQLHSLSPATVDSGPDLDAGQVYQAAWYGDAQNYLAPDLIESLAPLALFAAERGDTCTVDAVRWVERNAAPGGAERLGDRIDDTEEIFRSILYFLVLDPAAGEPADPRPALPLTHFAPGAQHLLARTSWRPDASWFTYSLSWQAVDHQKGDGNSFELYRKGEWLTKQQVAYSAKSSQYYNTLAIQNSRPEHYEKGDPRYELSNTGSQWTYDVAGDPVLLGHSTGDGYVYAAGDATNLCHSTYEGSTDVVEATRSVVWLEPDHVVVFDRAETRTDGRFKRFWLQLPAAATVDGQHATMKTAQGQQLFVSTVLPDAAKLSVERAERSDDIAVGDPIRFRLRVEDPAQPRRVLFLHVVQGADGGAAADPTTALASTTGTPFVGVAVAGTAVLFPRARLESLSPVTVPLPAGTGRILVTGLTAGAGYEVSRSAGTVTIGPGGDIRADAGGVLTVRG